MEARRGNEDQEIAVWSDAEIGQSESRKENGPRALLRRMTTAGGPNLVAGRKPPLHKYPSIPIYACLRKFDIRNPLLLGSCSHGESPTVAECGALVILLWNYRLHIWVHLRRLYSPRQR
ncbi:uncharacterized protein VTP21DRAFT_1210 [Calcarisporiella thermophila]|uniref:uncharacterized protein n=1 Tax=Calcarisporiella thermophila TaxID=911321 RepID=UPI0037422993